MSALINTISEKIKILTFIECILSRVNQTTASQPHPFQSLFLNFLSGQSFLNCPLWHWEYFKFFGFDLDLFFLTCWTFFFFSNLLLATRLSGSFTSFCMTCFEFRVSFTFPFVSVCLPYINVSTRCSYELGREHNIIMALSSSTILHLCL